MHVLDKGRANFGLQGFALDLCLGVPSMASGVLFQASSAPWLEYVSSLIDFRLFMQRRCANLSGAEPEQDRRRWL